MVYRDGSPTYVDGLAVYHRPHAGRPRVVFIHGAMDRAASFLRAIRRLPDLDVVRYDRRGYGRSAHAGVCATMMDQVDDLWTVMDGEPAVVIGHSFGGLIGLAAARLDPLVVTAVGAFEAPMPWAPWWPTTSAGGLAVQTADPDGPEAAAEKFMRRMIGDAHWDRLPASTRAARRAEGVALVSELRTIRTEGAPFDARALHVPVVAGTGSASDPQHQRAARVLAAEVPAAELFTIEGARHGAHYSHPREFATFVERVVARNAAARR